MMKHFLVEKLFEALPSESVQSKQKHWLHVSRLFTAEVDHSIWAFLKMLCPKMFSLSRFPTEYDHFS